jgi:hypothetical protein
MKVHGEVLECELLLAYRKIVVVRDWLTCKHASCYVGAATLVVVFRK